MSDKANNVVKNSFYSVVQILLTSLSLLIIYFIIIKKLGKAELGAWSIITSVPAAISVFGSGVSGCVLRHVPVYIVKNDKTAFNGIIFNGLFFNFLLGGLIVILGYSFSMPILQFLFSKHEIPYYYIQIFHLALVTLFLNFLSSVMMSAIDGLQLIYIRNKIMIAGSLALCISGAIFIQFWNLKGVLFAQLTQSLIIISLLINILVRQELFSFRRLRLDRMYLKLFLTYGQGFQVISISILLFEPITKYFLNKYFNLSVVGIYDLVNRIVIQIRTLVVSAVQAIVPMVTMSKEQGTLDISAIYLRTNRGASLLSFSLYSTVICVGMFAVSYFEKGHVSVYLFMTLFLSIASHFNIVSSTAYSILMGLGKLKDVIYSHLISSGLNILLFLLLRFFLQDSLMVFPVSASIIVSSLYLLSAFKRQIPLVQKRWDSSDLYIVSLTILTIFLTCVLVLFHFDHWFLFGLSFIHGLLLLYLMFRNDFFHTLAIKILNLKK